MPSNERSVLAVALVALTLLGCSGEEPESRTSAAGQAIVLNAGFQHQIVATGLNQPTAMAIAPDGRIFVSQQTGQVKVVKNGAVLGSSFLEVAVDSANERGLVGIALDPSFAANGFVYVFYTTTSGGTHNRVSRFTANGDVAVAGSEAILVDFPALSSASNHNSGALHFGTDGKLYVAHGDNAETANAQNLNNPFGKLHRFNADGSIPSDNPFFNTSTGVARAIWAYGLRNPFTFAFERSSGKLFANDVGGGDPEEINAITKGANYGHGGGPAPVPPVYSYPRDAGRCAITGGTFYNPTVASFPSSFVGKYFFADYCSSQIWFMNQDGTGVTVFADDSNGELNNPVDLDIGLDGSLYYLQRGSGAKIGRIFSATPACSTNADCSDNDVCSGLETCVGGACQAGTPLSCDDGNACTTNACSPSSGCNYPSNGQCCTSNADCNDNRSCTTDSCIDQLCQHVEDGTCNTCVKLRSQRTNNYLVLDSTMKVIPGGSLNTAQVFEKVPSGAGFKFKSSSGSYLRVAGNDLTADAPVTSAPAFTEYDCSSGGAYPGGKGYASLTGTAPHWKATTTTGPIQSGDGGNGASCAAGSADSWERFYPETVACSSSGPVCGDGICNAAESCTSCAADCGTCSGESCFKIRSQRTGDYLILDAASRVVPGGTQAVAEVFEKLASGSGFKFRGSSGSYLRLAASDLIVDSTEASAVVFSEHDCSSAGSYPGGKGYSSPTGAAPHWKATTTTGPIQSGDGGNAASCAAGDATSWERFYLEATTCGSITPACGDGSCNGAETCSSCAQDCGTCSGGACFKIRSQRTNDYLVLDAANKVIPGGSLAQAQVFEKVAAGSGFQFKGSSGSYARVVANDLTVDSSASGAVTFTEHDCSSGGLYPGGKGYSSPVGTAPHWKATTTTGPIKSGDEGNGSSCASGSAGSWERFYLEAATCSNSTPSCGDGSCNAAETCSSCQADCGTCSSTPAKLTLTRTGDGGGWSNVAGLSDGDLNTKVSSAVSPNCVTYSLGGAYTITSARVLEDNAGAWHLDTWKVQYDSGAGFADAFAYTATPSAMPAWNTVDFPDRAGVTRVNVCLQNDAPIEAAELEVWGYGTPEAECGDRTCSAGETCSSCPWDCDTCAGTELGLDARPSNTTCVAGDGSTEPPLLLSDSPCFVSVANPPVLASGVLPYSIAEPFWSDSAFKTRYLAIPNGTTFNVESDGDFTLPPGAVTIKNFRWQGQYFETRFFVRFTGGSYGAWTYRWSAEQDEAFLVDAIDGDQTVLAGGHVWSYPTEAQCFECHTTAAGSSLGIETRQLNVDQVYPSTGRSANQFDTLAGIGMLSGNLTSLPPFPAHGQSSASLQMRADAYLHVNCSNCHRPGGTGYGPADYRFSTLLANKNICNQQSILNAYPGLDLLEPGAPEDSVIWLRMSQRQSNFMPPLGSTLPDGEGAALLQQWIDSLTGCP